VEVVQMLLRLQWLHGLRQWHRSCCCARSPGLHRGAEGETVMEQLVRLCRHGLQQHRRLGWQARQKVRLRVRERECGGGRRLRRRHVCLRLRQREGLRLRLRQRKGLRKCRHQVCRLRRTPAAAPTTAAATAAQLPCAAAAAVSLSDAAPRPRAPRRRVGQRR
jgi:hypothetical protein